MVFRGFVSAIAILISIVVGYLSALAFGVMDFSAISSASVFSLPTFMLPKFNLQAILIILLQAQEALQRPAAPEIGRAHV